MENLSKWQITDEEKDHFISILIQGFLHGLIVISHLMIILRKNLSHYSKTYVWIIKN